MTALGWAPKVSIEEGLKKTHDWYLENKAEFNK
jgi:dTDP-D-glucose 4,6-dehydratase